MEDYFPAGRVPRETCNRHIALHVCRASGLLPGQYCPSWEIEPWVFLQRPPFELTDERWRGEAGRGPEDSYQMPPEEYCTEHSWRHYRPWQ